MRRAMDLRRGLYQARIREHHTQTWDLPGMGRIMQLTPDKKPQESLEQYGERCFKQVKAIKEQGDSINHLTLVVRGTVLSPDPKIQKETIDLFTRESAGPPKLTQRVAKSLTRGHMALYRKEQFISHLPEIFPNLVTALATDVRRAINDGHKTSFYIVQIDVGILHGLDDRLMTSDVLKYNLKPTEHTDNCASAVAKKVVPGLKLLPLHINPIAATEQIVLYVAQKSCKRDDLYGTIVSNLKNSGVTRGLEEIALEEHTYKASDDHSKSIKANPKENSPSQEARVEKDDDVSSEQSKGPKG